MRNLCCSMTVAWLVGAASYALASETPTVGKEQPVSSAKRQYEDALRKGRRFDREGKLIAARQAFEDAIAADPGGVEAMSELGLVAYRLKDLPAAEKASRDAVHKAMEPKLRAASLYNLGLVLTDKGDKSGAIAALTESDRLRPNITLVMQALARLDPAWAARKWFTVKTLLGPESAKNESTDALRDKLCRSLYQQVQGEDSLAALEVGVSFKCTTTSLKVDLKGTGLLAAQLWTGQRGMVNYNSGTILLLAVKTEKGWFVETLDSGVTAKWGGSRVSASNPRPRVVQRKGSARGAILLLNFETLEEKETFCRRGRSCEEKGSGEYIGWTTEYLVAVGVGPAAVPSMMPSLPIVVSVSFGKESGVAATMKRSFDYDGEGHVVLGALNEQYTDKDALLLSKDRLFIPPGSYELIFQ